MHSFAFHNLFYIEMLGRITETFLNEVLYFRNPQIVISKNLFDIVSITIPCYEF